MSILTPSFGQAPWLGDNLASVRCQTHPSIEHIVMDGGSTDGTVELLEAAGASVVWRSETDRGQADAINKAFAASKGEIIGWINSDDAYVDRRVVEDVVAFFASHPDVDVAYGHGLQITEDGAIIQVLWAPPFDAELLKAVSIITQPTAFFRRSALSEPMLDDSFHFTMDYELWLRLSSQSRRFARIDRLTAVDRHQSARKSSTIKDVHEADLVRLEGIYDTHFGAEYDAVRSAWYRRQRIMGATLIPRIGSDLAFETPAHAKRGLWRRQIASRRSTWPAQYR